MPPDPAVLDSIAQLHAECLEAARVADAAAIAAGRVRLELKRGMRVQAWRDFLTSPTCPVPHHMVGDVHGGRDRRGRARAAREGRGGVEVSLGGCRGMVAWVRLSRPSTRTASR